MYRGIHWIRPEQNNYLKQEKPTFCIIQFKEAQRHARISLYHQLSTAIIIIHIIVIIVLIIF